MFGIIEQVGAMPGNGGTSMFRFGEGFGIVKGVLATLGIGYVTVVPPRWKKWAGLIGADKDASRTMRNATLPWDNTMAYTQKRQCGRADAILLARYGWEQESHANPSRPLNNYDNSTETPTC